MCGVKFNFVVMCMIAIVTASLVSMTSVYAMGVDDDSEAMLFQVATLSCRDIVSLQAGNRAPARLRPLYKKMMVSMAKSLIVIGVAICIITAGDSPCLNENGKLLPRCLGPILGGTAGLFGIFWLLANTERGQECLRR